MKVLLTKDIPTVGKDILTENGVSFDILSKEKVDNSILIQKLKDYQALMIVGSQTLDRDFLQSVQHLKGIALFSVGYDNVDISAAKEFKLPIGNTPDVLNDATANTAFLLMIATSRKAFGWARKIPNGEWGTFNATENLGQELKGKTLGIFGMGRIGQTMAEMAKGAYGMKIIYHNRSPKPDAEEKLQAKYVSFEELLTKSDVISVHANLSNETKGLFNQSTFEKMKNNAIFINTARGAIHNELDLIEALNNGTIWGAGLDVTNPEPMAANNPLLEMANACVIPHIGSATQEARDGMATRAAQNIVACLQGKEMPYKVV